MKELYELFLSTPLFSSSMLGSLRTGSCQCDVTATCISGIGGNGTTLHLIWKETNNTYEQRKRI